MKHYTICLLTIALVLMYGCKGDYGNDEPSQLVVEGWIDNGEFPMVFVTRSVPISEEYQEISNLGQYLERWAKVTISDGEREEVLVGRLNHSYYPPFYYTTSYMRGEPGKTYRLHVEGSGGLTADAETTITSETAVIDSFWVTPVENNDTLYQLHQTVRTIKTLLYLRHLIAHGNIDVGCHLTNVLCSCFKHSLMTIGFLFLGKGSS